MRGEEQWAVGSALMPNKYLSPLQGDGFRGSDPGVARETRLPLATFYRAFSARKGCKIYPAFDI